MVVNSIGGVSTKIQATGRGCTHVFAHVCACTHGVLSVRENLSYRLRAQTSQIKLLGIFILGKIRGFQLYINFPLILQ